jgi:membrane protein EpsK
MSAVKSIDTDQSFRLGSVGSADAVAVSKVLANRRAPARGRFLTNLISNAAFFGFNLVVGIWFTPYLIRHLGTKAYGIIPLVSQITGYMIVVTATLNSAVGRYVTIALERHNDEEANRYFNTSLFGSVLLVLLLIPLTVWATAYIGNIIVVPEGQEAQTRWLFVCTVAGFFLGTLQSPFGVSTYCLNRFDLQNAISLIQLVARIGVVVVFFSIVTPQIWHVGLAALAAMCLGWGWSIRLWRRLTPSLCISISHFSRVALKHLFSMGGWIAINSIGAILYLSIDLLVVNRMFGPESGGRYAAVMQWSTLLRTLVAVVAGLFGPTMLYFYARHDIDGLSRYGQKAVKLVGLLMALPIGLICGLSTPLLQTWLGPKFADLAWLMSLMTVHLSVNLAVIPLFSIQTVTNRVRTPAIVTMVMGIGNLALAIFLAGPMGWGLYGVAAAGAIALSAKNLIFTPLYAAHILNRRLDAFFWEILPIILATIGMAGIAKLLASTWDIAGWVHLIAAGTTLSIIYAAVGYWVLLNREERALAWSMVPWFSAKKSDNRT